MITKQEQELAKHEIADISYDLSVRDDIHVYSRQRHGGGGAG